MAFTIELTEAARRNLSGLTKKAQSQVLRRIKSLAVNPTPVGVKTLQGKTDRLYRIRSGDYRVIYKIEHGILVIVVIRIGHRREVYRGI